MQLRDQVHKIHELRIQAAEIQDQTQREIEALVILALVEADRALSEADIAKELQRAGFDIAIKEAYPLVTKLVKDNRIQKEGLKYRALRPDVLNRQLRDSALPETPSTD